MKKYILLLVALMTVSGAALAQECLGLWLTPEINGLNFAVMVGKVEQKPKSGLSGGFSIQLPVNERIGFRTGLGYSWKSYSYKNTGLIFSSDIHTPPTPNTESRIEADYKNTEIQVPASFIFSGRNSRLYLAAGAEIIYATMGENDRTIYYGDGSSEKLQKVGFSSPWYFTPVLGFGYGQKLGSSLQVTIEPQIKFYLKDYPAPAARQYCYGLRLGLSRLSD